MQDVQVVFETIFSEYLHVFSRDFNCLFELSQDLCALSPSSFSYDAYLKEKLLQMPQLCPRYPFMIQHLTEFTNGACLPPGKMDSEVSSSRSAVIIVKLAKKVKIELSQATLALPITSLSFRQNDPNHNRFSTVIYVYILCDLMASLFPYDVQRKSHQKIISCAFEFASLKPQFPESESILINKFGYMLSFMSQHSLNSISLSLDQSYEPNNAGRLFMLVSQLKTNESFIESLWYITNQLKKQKLLSSEVLSGLASLISTCECDPETLKEISSLAWSLRNNKALKTGAFQLIAATLSKSDPDGKATNFLQTRILPRLSDEKKAGRSLRCLVLFLRNDPSKTASMCRKLIHSAVLTSTPEYSERLLSQLCSIDSELFAKEVALPIITKGPNDPRFGILTDTFQVIPPSIRAIYSKYAIEHFSVLEAEIRSLSFAILSRDVTKEVDSNNFRVQEFARENGYVLEQINPDQSDTAEFALRWHSSYLNAAKSFMTSDDLNNPDVVRAIVFASSSACEATSWSGKELMRHLAKDDHIKSVVVSYCTGFLFQPELYSINFQSMRFIHEFLNMSEQRTELMTVSFIFLASSVPHIRLLALKVLRKLKCTVVESLDANSEVICESAKLSYSCTEIPEKPTYKTLPPGYILFDHVCGSSFTGLWFFFFASCLDVLIETNQDELFEMMHSKILAFIKSKLPYSNFNMNFLYLLNKSAQISNGHALSLKKSKNANKNITLIRVLPYLNSKGFPSICAFLSGIDDPSLIGHITYSLVYIVQQPNTFTEIFPDIFKSLKPFFVNIQKFLFGSRVIRYDKDTVKHIVEKKDLIIAFCMIIAAVFGNLQDTVPESEWPLSFRRGLVQSLSQLILCNEFPESIRLHALNACTYILNTGSVFTDGYALEPKLLNHLLSRQLIGYDVLPSLLYFHADSLFTLYVQEALKRRPKEESEAYIEAIGAVLQSFDDVQIIRPNLGPLVLLGFHSLNFEGRGILMKISELFMPRVSHLVASASLSSLTDLFIFSSEHVMKSALEIAAIGGDASAAVPFFQKARLLPSSSRVIQGVSSEYRVFTVASLLDLIVFYFNDAEKTNPNRPSSFKADLDSSLSLDSIYIEISIPSGNPLPEFDPLLTALLSYEDDHPAVFEYLYSCKPASGHLFKSLVRCHPEPTRRFLSSRLSLAYHLFCPSIPPWVLPLAAEQSAPAVLHKVIMHLPYTKALLTPAFKSFGPETLDAVTANTPDLGSVARLIPPETLEAWKLEAFRWAVGSKSFIESKVSVFILKSLGGFDYPLTDQIGNLLIDAVSFHAIGKPATVTISYIRDCICLYPNQKLIALKQAKRTLPTYAAAIASFPDSLSARRIVTEASACGAASVSSGDGEDDFQRAIIALWEGRREPVAVTDFVNLEHLSGILRSKTLPRIEPFTSGREIAEAMRGAAGNAPSTGPKRWSSSLSMAASFAAARISAMMPPSALGGSLPVPNVRDEEVEYIQPPQSFLISRKDFSNLEL